MVWQMSTQWPVSTQKFLQGLIAKHSLLDSSRNPQTRDVLARLYDEFYSGISFQGPKPAKDNLQFQQTFRAHIELILRGMRPQIQNSTASVELVIKVMPQSMRRIPHDLAKSPLATPPATPLLHQQPEVVLPVTAPVLQQGPSIPTAIPSPITPQEPRECFRIAMIANFWNAMDAEDQMQVFLKIMATAKDPRCFGKG